MFGADFEKYYKENENEVNILAIGKYSDNFETCEPLPSEQNLVIQEKGTYLVQLGLAKDNAMYARMRVVVG